MAHTTPAVALWNIEPLSWNQVKACRENPTFQKIKLAVKEIFSNIAKWVCNTAKHIGNWVLLQRAPETATKIHPPMPAASELEPLLLKPILIEPEKTPPLLVEDEIVGGEQPGPLAKPQTEVPSTPSETPLVLNRTPSQAPLPSAPSASQLLVEPARAPTPAPSQASQLSAPSAPPAPSQASQMTTSSEEPVVVEPVPAPTPAPSQASQLSAPSAPPAPSQASQMTTSSEEPVVVEPAPAPTPAPSQASQMSVSSSGSHLSTSSEEQAPQPAPSAEKIIIATALDEGEDSVFQADELSFKIEKLLQEKDPSPRDLTEIEMVITFPEKEPVESPPLATVEKTERSWTTFGFQLATLAIVSAAGYYGYQNYPSIRATLFPQMHPF